MKDYTAIVVSWDRYDGGASWDIMDIKAESDVHARAYAITNCNTTGECDELVFLCEGKQPNIATAPEQAYRVNDLVVIIDGVRYKREA